MSIDEKLNRYFAGSVVRKDLVKKVKGNAIVPTYVLEYLLGQYCATDDEETILNGVESVKEILKKHYVHRNEAELVKSHIKEKGRYKIIDKVSVELNEKRDVYFASFANLGIKDVIISSDVIKKHPKLLVGGVWCIVTLEYIFSEDAQSSPWIMSSIKPIQMSYFDIEQFLEARDNFEKDEWIDALIQSIGFEPSQFSFRNKMFQLTRLIPYCERNYNLIELGPKGTGKSHIYTEFSPHGILISGGEVTVAKLFVNNRTGKLGLVGYWDCVAFDEFAGKEKKVDKALVDIMKNYMANKSFSRGIETLGAEASMSFVGNTKNTVAYMLKHSDLFEELPDKFHDSAFLDRLHFFIPGWEVDIIRAEMFTSGYGFVVDYIAEVLRHFRNEDFSNLYQEYFELSNDISTRDKDAINKTFSGLMKIIYPNGKAEKEQIEELLQFAIEGRKRVKDQLHKIDKTYAPTKFYYKDLSSGKEIFIKTLEEEQYPNYYSGLDYKQENQEKVESKPKIPIEQLKEQHLSFKENQKGITYEKLFKDYIKDASKITITDPYIRIFFQIRNLMEFILMVIDSKDDDKIVDIHLITIENDQDPKMQLDYFEQIQKSVQNAGVNFTWEFDKSKTIHARSIVTDSGWKIILDRGLDIYQHYDMNNIFDIANKLQQFRGCKGFEITYVKLPNH